MIIAVCGNSGSGKSTIAIKLAMEFASRHLNTVLIDTNFITPQFNIWFPQKEMFNHLSLSILLDNNIDVEAVTDKMRVVSDHLGVLGYGRDYASNATPRRYDTSAQLLRALNEISDVIIVDAQTEFINDILSFESISAADVRIITLTPDLKGLSWYDSNIKMMEENWKDSEATILKVFNKVYNKSPISEIEAIIGNGNYYLPESTEIEEQMHTGSMDSLNGRQSSAKKFISILKTMADDIESKLPKEE